MGLFDRKRAEAPPPPAHEPEAVPERRPEAEAKPEEPAKPTVVTSTTDTAGNKGYGIQNAIELMRKLPAENVTLVVEVVKKTLESLNVDIGAIIEDAERKQERIDERVSKLNAEIRDFEEEIAARKQEITALTADRDETRTVRERLELAQKGPAPGVAAADVPPPGGRPTPMPRAASAFGTAAPRPATRPEIEDGEE